jgi:uncharacterized protein YbaR (Trm112 family)
VLSPDLLKLLVCPVSKRPLIYFSEENALICPASKLRYRVTDGVPQLIEEEGQKLSEAEITTWVAKARSLGLPIPT